MILVYKYGLLPPTVNVEIVYDQMYKATKHYNNIIKVRREFRKKRRAWRASPQLEIAVAKATREVQEAEDRLKQERIRIASKKVDDSFNVELKRARKAKEETMQMWREARKLIVVPQETKTQIAEDFNKRECAIRKESELHFGTYQLVEMAVDRADRDKKLYDKDNRPSDPKFHRWTGEGSVSVQINDGILLVRDIGLDHRVRIENLSPEKRPGKPRYGTLVMRVGPKDAPSWAEWPIKMHRPLPDGQIKRVTVSCQKIGPRTVWEVMFSLAQVDDPYIENRAKTGTVGVKIGWKTTPQGLQAATWHGSDGCSGQLIVGKDIIGGLTKVKSLKSIRDTAFDSCMVLQPWYSGMVIRLDEASPW